MNLVKQIMDQLSGSALGQLSSLLGTDAETTERAASAAVPSLLSALAGTASTNDGAKKLTNLLGGLDSTGVGNIAQMLSGDSGSLLSKGTSLLGSLFGSSAISGIVNAISRFAGLGSGAAKNLLAYLLPMVLGKVAAQWKNQGGTTQALTSLFADQRDNIKNAAPAGFSLSDIHSVTETAKPAYRSTHADRAEPVGVGSPAKWLLPLGLALLGGFFLWQFLSRPRDNQVVAERPRQSADEVTARKPVVPETAATPELVDVRDNVGGLFRSLDTTFTGIQDAASAERALPALEELNTKIDATGRVLSQLPAASVTTLRPLIEEQVRLVTEKANAASSIEGISDRFKTLIQQIVTKIAKWIAPTS